MYKNYNISQLSLPLTTDFSFSENDIASIVNEIVERVPEDAFSKYQNNRGASSYNPRMMLKIILYAYSNSIFSGRKIEFALTDSIRFMWLAQEQTPSYKTINHFRSDPRTNDLIKDCYAVFRTILVENHYIEEDAIYIDGTKIEADDDAKQRKLIRSERTILKKYKKVVSECKEKKVKYE